MEKLRRLVHEIAYTKDHSQLSAAHRSLIPFLSLASSLYKIALSLRYYLYHLALFPTHRLPVPVISVGNLTWGGNGKTPMVEFISRLLRDSGVSPLILTRGYAGGDEAKMLARHLLGEGVKIGVGADRAAIAIRFLEKYGYSDPSQSLFEGTAVEKEKAGQSNFEKIGAVILDDGMQHWSLLRDLDIVMINGLMPWGNGQLVPLGPLRETLSALKRADVVVIHHANLVPEQNLNNVKLIIQEVKESIHMFFTRMAPSHLFEVGNVNCRVPPDILYDAVVLCVSAIGSANAFVQGLKKTGARYMDQLDFSDHHKFQDRDIEMIRMKLKELESMFHSNPVVVVTEKDYDRDPVIFNHLPPFKVMVLCSEFQIIPHGKLTEDDFKRLLREQLKAKFGGPQHN